MKMYSRKELKMKMYVKVDNINEVNAIIAIVGLEYVEHLCIGEVFYDGELQNEQFVEVLKSYDDVTVEGIVSNVEVPSTIYSFLDFMKNYKEIIDSVTVEK